MTNRGARRQGLWTAALLLGMLAGAGRSLFAQQVGGDPASEPTAYGIRFTPEMARVMARHYVEGVAVRRYELPEDRADEAVEDIARRVMAMAHELDKQGYHKAVETMVEEVMRAQSDGPSRGMSPAAGQSLARGLEPALPLVRELVQGVVQDIRPMLPVKQQLKLGGDIMAFSTAMDAFEGTLDRWSKGDVQPRENPFQPESERIKKDETGRSQTFKHAERRAQQEVKKGEWTRWKKYVESAKAFYEFDEAQSATAESILDEALQRVEAIRVNGQWEERALGNRMWFQMLWSLNVGSPHPLRYCVKKRYDRLAGPIETIGAELRKRVDEIPTARQRQTAEERAIQRLTDEGYDLSVFEEPEAAAQVEN